jgi:hypothetical protein
MALYIDHPFGYRGGSVIRLRPFWAIIISNQHAYSRLSQTQIQSKEPRPQGGACGARAGQRNLPLGLKDVIFKIINHEMGKDIEAVRAEKGDLRFTPFYS